jgi:hypothetical protein
MPDNGAVRRSLDHCALCGQALLRKSADDGHGVKYHLLCLVRRRAIVGSSEHLLRRPLAKANGGTPFVIQALGSGTACLACLVSTTGRSEPEIVSALRALRADVNLMVGSCSRCGAEARLLCGLVAA